MPSKCQPILQSRSALKMQSDLKLPLSYYIYHYVSVGNGVHVV